MIISRTPLRISIGGGGTDLPSYYSRFRRIRHHPAAVNKHIYVGINETFSGGYLLKYSSLEHAVSIDEIRHALIREALRLHEVPAPIGRNRQHGQTSPPAPGLGFLGSLLLSGSAARRCTRSSGEYHVDPGVVAEEACKIEIEILQQPAGKQGTSTSPRRAGGLAPASNFMRTARSPVNPLNISNSTLYDLEEHLHNVLHGLFAGNASVVLDDQKVPAPSWATTAIARQSALHQAARPVHQAGSIEKGDTRQLLAS